MKKIIILIVLIALAYFGMELFRSHTEYSYEQEGEKIEELQELTVLDAEETEPELVILEQRTGALSDVTNGKTVRGITTSENTTATSTAYMTEEGYKLNVEFENLPAALNDDFYEGWIVRRGDDFSVISTGVLIADDKVPGTYSNIYTSDINLMDHDFYVLTIEPNDGDPAPADHVLEGTMK